MAAPAAERKARRAASAALDRKALDLVVLDVRELSSVTDYYLLCSGRSTTHLRSIVDGIREEMKGADARLRHGEGTAESGWMLLDYGDVLVHVFLEETRVYYALERLWGDAPSVPLER
jgi:ribosome-associated protein